MELTHISVENMTVFQVNKTHASEIWLNTYK